MNISACLVIHNEEEYLERCLLSIKDVVTEIIVVHDGECEDESLMIAKKLGAKTFQRQYIGEAEHHRPFSYQQVKGDWILQIDADEYLEKDAKDKILGLIKNNEIDAYSFWWPYFVDGKYLDRGPFAQTYKPCLFRKNKTYMLGISHEYPRTYGVVKKIKDIWLRHEYNYDKYNERSFQEKWIPWVKIQASQIYNIEKAPVFNIGTKENNPHYQKYLKMRHHPLVEVLKDIIRFIGLFIIRGILLTPLPSIKIAWYELRYLWYVGIFLNNLKNGRRI